jgi:hypothetical protein
MELGTLASLAPSLLQGTKTIEMAKTGLLQTAYPTSIP